MNGWIRFTVIVGGGVFAFSVLVGLLAGVPFGNALVRAFASSVVIGALAAAGAHLVPRLLPGLIDPDAASDPPRSEGGSVDIVVDDTSDEDRNDAASAGSLIEEVVEQSAPDAGEVMNAVIEEQRDGGVSALGDEDLDQMPDIGSMAGSFVSGGGDDEARDQSGGEFGDFDPVGDIGTETLTSDQESEAKTIAKAMRTMMTRDT